LKQLLQKIEKMKAKILKLYLVILDMRFIKNTNKIQKQ